MARTCNSGIHVTMRYSTVYKLLFFRLLCHSQTSDSEKPRKDKCESSNLHSQYGTSTDAFLWGFVNLLFCHKEKHYI